MTSSNPFAGRDPAHLNRGVSKEQRDLLRRFMGNGVPGAVARAADFSVPVGLTRDTLLRYQEIARQAVGNGNDPIGVQRMRLELIGRALSLLAR